MKYQTFLLFGAPGSGKGTQGKTLGTIPRYYHCACGDVFRSIDTRTKVGKAFLEYSSKGQLVPDDITVELWREAIDAAVDAHKFKPDIDTLVLDGIPRNVGQAKIMNDMIDVKKVFHLACPDRETLFYRLKKRALKENRLDDAVGAVTVFERRECRRVCVARLLAGRDERVDVAHHVAEGIGP